MGSSPASPADARTGSRCASSGGARGACVYADLIDLFEQSAADRTPLRQIVGDDPVEFIETFVRNYPKGQWLIRERERLTKAIARAAEEEARGP